LWQAHLQIAATDRVLLAALCGVLIAAIRNTGSVRLNYGVKTLGSAAAAAAAAAALACRNNYMGTMELMRLAAGFEQLRSFVHGALQCLSIAVMTCSNRFVLTQPCAHCCHDRQPDICQTQHCKQAILLAMQLHGRHECQGSSVCSLPLVIRCQQRQR
jgi:hypothetical protein